MIRPAFLLLFVAGLAFSARSFLPPGAAGGATTLALGFLLLAALQTGHIFNALRLPHLTGFLLTGLVFGPEVLGLLTPEMVSDLAPVKRVAVGLIALHAGCELNLRALRPRLRAVGMITAFGLLLAGVMLWGFFFVATEWLPFAEGMNGSQRAVVALVAANALIALSPAVVIGIVSETRSQGPLTELALGLVVLADLVVVLAFSASESVARTVFTFEAQSGGAASLTAHIVGSLIAGAALGAVLAVFVSRVGRKVGLFVFGALFVVAEAGGALHIDPLLCGLAAGLFLENISQVSGEHVVAETQSASLPTFAVFFAVVGAEIHVREFWDVAGWAVAAAGVRALGMWVGARTAAHVVSLEPELARRIPYGMFPQAGVAIALALLVKSRFGAWGEALGTLLLGTILVNEMVGPVLWRIALVRAGETGRRGTQAAAHSRRAQTVTPPPELVTPP